MFIGWKMANKTEMFNERIKTIQMLLWSKERVTCWSTRLMWCGEKNGQKFKIIDMMRNKTYIELNNGQQYTTFDYLKPNLISSCELTECCCSKK